MTLNDFFTSIETQYQNNLPFVAYRKPAETRVSALLQSDDALYTTQDFVDKGFVFSPFEDTDSTILIPLEVSKVLSVVLESEIPITSKTNQLQKTVNETDKAFHIKLVNKGVEAIKNGLFKKVVLSRKEHVLIEDQNPIEIFKKLLNTYKSSFIYCWYHPQIGLWLGATPETLIKIEGSQFSIMALAGTQDYKGTLDVVWQEKEIKEQKFVTDFIVESLQPVVESLKISATETVKAGNLVHLKTMISARLKSNSNLKTIIATIHPTPAVCGLPKELTRQFILDNENYNREYYTGFLGELNLDVTSAPRLGKRNIENRAYTLNKKSTQLYVNLRCMQLQNNNAFIYVGGGITETSHAESEWQETVSKSLVIKNVL